jgi:hypothetical protein
MVMTEITMMPMRKPPPPPTKAPSGIQQRYVYEVHQRMKLELSGKLKGLSEMWLLDHLTNNNWWIRREQAQKIAHKLRLPREHLAYYQDIYIWIPDKRWGIKLCCPTCKKSGSHVQAHGFRDNHYARLVVGMKETYYVLSRRYFFSPTYVGLNLFLFETDSHISAIKRYCIIVHHR